MGINTPHTSESESSYEMPRVPAGLKEARKHLMRLLPSLLRSHEQEWVYVSSDGRHEVGLSQDETEIKAETAGIPHDKYIVRLISEMELEEDDESETMGSRYPSE